MNLGFDLDKVFIDYPPIIPSVLIDRLYRSSSNNKLLYRIPSREEQFLRLITHLSFLRPSIRENMEFIKRLSLKKEHRYYLISSRFSFLRKKTDALIKKHSFEKIFDSMFFNFEDKQPHIFKNEILTKLNVHRYVDDDLLLLKFLSAKNTKIKFFWINKKKSHSLTRNLFAITELKSILE